MPAQGDDPERSECELLTVPVVAGEWLLVEVDDFGTRRPERRRDARR